MQASSGTNRFGRARRGRARLLPSPIGIVTGVELPLPSSVVFFTRRLADAAIAAVGLAAACIPILIAVIVLFRERLRFFTLRKGERKSENLEKKGCMMLGRCLGCAKNKWNRWNGKRRSARDLFQIGNATARRHKMPSSSAFATRRCEADRLGIFRGSRQSFRKQQVN